MRKALALTILLSLVFMLTGCIGFRIEVKVEILPNPVLPVASFGAAIEIPNPNKEKDNEKSDNPDMSDDDVSADGMRASDP